MGEFKARLKIEHGVRIPTGAKVRGALEEIWAPVLGKMRIGDSIRFDTGREVIMAYTWATRYSRRYKKNKWRFRTSQVGECRMWRIE